ncbi:MAG: hypothetical protein ACPGUD_03565 [Parashewanella sp.]
MFPSRYSKIEDAIVQHLRDYGYLNQGSQLTIPNVGCFKLSGRDVSYKVSNVGKTETLKYFKCEKAELRSISWASKKVIDKTSKRIVNLLNYDIAKREATGEQTLFQLRCIQAVNEKAFSMERKIISLLEEQVQQLEQALQSRETTV